MTEFSCPVCGEEWSTRKKGSGVGETRLSFMNRHRDQHEQDIDAEEFFQEGQE